MRANRSGFGFRYRTWGAAVLALGLLPGVSPRAAAAQAAASTTPAPATARQIGTIQAIAPASLQVTSDKGETISVVLAAETKVVQLAVGSTDLKTAQPASITDLAVGDRVLVLGAAGDTPSSITARRLVLMKSSDIARQRAAEQAGWQHGTGGLVSAVDPASGQVTIKSGVRTILIATGPSTILRRYAPTSARFEDATRSTLATLHVGDQLRVRGERAADGSIKADEIISGSFQHLSGIIQAVDTAAGQLTLRDSKTHKSTILSVTAGTAIHELPPEVADRFAARARAGAAAHAAPTRTAAPATTPETADAASPRTGGGDLSQVVSRLPLLPLSDLKVGDTVMAVGAEGNAGAVTAVTILGGVQAILAAAPEGGAEMTLSPWSVGGGAETGGSQ